MALDDEILQRYFDGELSPAEEQRVRKQVEQSPEAQQRLKQLAQISELMREAFADAARGLDGDALFASIQQDVKKQEALGFGERFRVISGEWLEHRRGVVFPTVASLAVAAAALLVLMVPREVSAPVAEAPGALAPVQTANLTVHGTRVENVDFGKSTGTVFEVDNEGVGAAVVWIADDDEEEP